MAIRLAGIWGGRTDLFWRVRVRGCRVDGPRSGRARRHTRCHADLVRRDGDGHVLVGVLGAGLVEAEADDLARRRHRLRMRPRPRLTAVAGHRRRVVRLGRLRRRALLDR